MEFREKRGARACAARIRAVVRACQAPDVASSLVVCGHWSTLDLLLAPNVLMLDSGCLWGGPLTAVQPAGPARLPGAESRRR